MKQYFKYIIEWITPEKRAEAVMLGQLPSRQEKKNIEAPKVPEWVNQYLTGYHFKKGSSYKEIAPKFKENLRPSILANIPSEENRRYILLPDQYYSIQDSKGTHDDILTYLQMSHLIDLDAKQFQYWNKFGTFYEDANQFPFICLHKDKNKMHISESYFNSEAKEIEKKINDKSWKFYKIFHKLMRETNTTFGGRH